jgi:predicted DNA-binding transcriptional regulator AlpA
VDCYTLDREHAVMSNIVSESSKSSSAEFIDEKQLLKRLPISRRTLWDWRAEGKIPFLRLGRRRVLYHWPSVQAALLRQQKGVGQ